MLNRFSTKCCIGIFASVHNVEYCTILCMVGHMVLIQASTVVQQFPFDKGNFYSGKCKFVLEPCKGHNCKSTKHLGNCCACHGLFRDLLIIWNCTVSTTGISHAWSRILRLLPKTSQEKYASNWFFFPLFYFFFITRPSSSSCLHQGQMHPQ